MATNFDDLAVNGIPLEPCHLQDYTFRISGDQTTGSMKGQFLILQPGEIVAVQAYLDMAPSGSDFIIDVNRNSDTLFPTQASRPTIAEDAQLSSAVVPELVAIAAGDRLSIDVDQVGSGTAGSDLAVTVSVKRMHCY